MKHLQSKISKVLVLYIVLFSSVVTLILTAIQLRLDYNEGINVIYQRVEQVRLTNIDSITQSLWTLDSSSIQIQLDGLSRINDIIFVKITDKDNKLIAAAGSVNTKNIITANIQLTQKYRGRNTPLGTLTIIATKENLYQQLISTIIVILISQAIKTFLVSLFILIIFYYLVTRHLEKISQHSAKLKFSSKPDLLTLNRDTSAASHNDELASVVNSINKMSSNMYSTYKDLLLNQNALAEREAQFSSIFNAISDAIFFANSDRKIIQVNPAFMRLFGYSLEEIKGHTTKMLYASPNEYDNQREKLYHSELHNTSLFKVEYKRKEGSTFIGETMGTPVSLPDGTQIGFIGIVRDISKRLLAEIEERQLQTQLQQSQKIEAIGQLTGGIAHDFNNILNSILGYSELSMMSIKKSGDNDLKSYLEQITIAGERARDLVAQMLSFSRSNPGEPQLIKLPKLIKEVISLLRPTIPSSIKLVTEIDELVPPVLMDNTQMHQILMNLCINARDAMGGNGTITIKLSYIQNIDKICSSCKKAFKGKYIKLTVEDTGSGIQPELIDKIFDPFMSTKDVGKGTGMGLSVVHGILHKHDSHIFVKSTPNRGTQFHIYIPPIIDNNHIEKTNDKQKKISHEDGKGKHILVVDDEKSIAIFLQKFLKSYNYQVTFTTSSVHALEIFKKKHADFDLIITDQTMPELSGTEMIKKIFQIRPDIPVVLCTGYSEQVNKESALEMGCALYMNKPIKLHTLLHALHDILQIKT